jgi:predicted outer membrane repeat protein
MASHRRLRPGPRRALCALRPLIETCESRQLLSGSAIPIGYTPAQIQRAYGFDQITFSNNVRGDGRGETIAIVDALDDPNIVHDLATFDSAFSLTPMLGVDATQAGPGIGTFLKVGQSGGAPTTAIDGTGQGEEEEALDVEWSHAIAPGANILLVEANSSFTSDMLAAVDYARSYPNVVAVSMSFYLGPKSEFAGETADDSHFTTPAGHAGVTFLAGSGDFGSVSLYPSASPNVLSVGGTSLSVNAANNWAGETAWSLSGGGVSPYEARPAYQDGVQSSAMRTTPDVAYDGNPSTGFAIADSVGFGLATPWVKNAGTSGGTPQWAALIAIVDQGLAVGGVRPLDGPSQTLKAIYALPAADFHDITSGSTGTYSAGKGYDLVTGRGSPNANRVVADLVNSYTTSLTATPVNASMGQSFQATVASFTVADPAGYTTGGFTAKINWDPGDGATTIRLDPATNAFDIIGGHTYSMGGYYAAHVSLTAPLGPWTAATVPVTVNFPVPLLTSIAPSRVAVGDPNPFTFALNGSNFTSQSAVLWNGSPLATTYVSSKLLEATVPASDLSALVTASIVVTNPAPGGGASKGLAFQVLAVPSTVYVNAAWATDPVGTKVAWTNGSSHYVGYDAFGTVQGGVDAVASFGTVNVAPATYPEAVTIDQSLTLAGAAGGNVVLQGSTVGTGLSINYGFVTVAGLTIEGYETGVVVSQSVAPVELDRDVVLANAAGGIANAGTLVLKSCTILDNSAANGGGINSTGALTVSGCTIAYNSAQLTGGGISASGTLTIDHSTVMDNTLVNYLGGQGSGIASFGGLTLTDSTVASNSGAGAGGGLYVIDYGLGTTIDSCTIVNNTSPGYGGGIEIGGGSVTLTNCTVANNSANVAGGIDDGGDLLIVNSTIAGNIAWTSSRFGGGGGLDTYFGAATLENTIVALNTLGSGATATPNDIFGTVDPSSANNLIGTGGAGGLSSGVNANLVGVIDPGLGVLGDNGGPTQTIALSAESPAIDAGDSTLYGAPALDQRGDPRVGGDDIGAFQVPTSVYVNASWASKLTGALVTWTDGSTLVLGYDAFGTIQAGVGAVAANGSVTVAGGTYTGQVVIDRSLTLTGHAVLQGAGSGIGVSVAASNVTMTGLTVEDFGTGVVVPDSNETAELDSCTITSNAASGDGGGIANAGTLVLNSCTITNNSAEYGGSAVGGGIDNTGTLAATKCTLTNNQADGGGGGIASTGTMVLTGCTISQNQAEAEGGGVLASGTTTLDHCTVTNNNATTYLGGTGGGIANSGALTLTYSSVTNNSATFGGGGLYDSGFSYRPAGTVVLGCMFGGNSAAVFGGGIAVSGSVMTVTNSTLANNSANSGGGIDDGGYLTVVNSTIAYNIAWLQSPSQGGGGLSSLGSSVAPVLDNTIVALNTLGPPSSAMPSDILGAVDPSSAYNLIGTGGSGGLTASVNGNLVGVASPGLGVLANNGGPTQTIALLAGSAAINAGGIGLAVDSQGNPLLFDQRGTGHARLKGAKVDIGAYEA